MGRFVDLTGMRFGRYTVLHRGDKRRDGASGRVTWLCRCDCGAARVVRGDHLASGHTKSCGCHSRDSTVHRNSTHGLSKTPEYHAWHDAILRCHDESNPGFRNYGGRGITVCDRWRNSFEDFLADAGPRPSESHSLDRIDNDRGYEPGNVRWATNREQCRNRRNNHIIEIDGRAMCLGDWAKELGIHRMTIYNRLRRGWPSAEAILTPVDRKRASPSIDGGKES